VLSVSKLGTNYKQFKDRRTLISGFDLFLADVKVVTMLPDRLGKYFYEKKKIPALIDLETDPAASVRQAINSTFLVSAKGPVYQLKVGRASMKPSEVADNVQAVLDSLPSVFPDLEPEHIRRVELKGDTTLALPIYCSLTKTELEAFAGTN
jgi:ribosome biogenesis protein UTP30